ncbi:MATE family efflux transporter [Oscillibacter ruminantium]|uniref:MATE family efflux transporter n=1 Tax=Oscillibacter ruminantium TaxID=1263547 RepID=UPI0003118A4D
MGGVISTKFSNPDLRKLIVPLVIEQLLAITVGLADSLMVARVGEAAVSAVSLVDAVNVLLVSLFSALATGGAVVAGQYMGRREMEKSQSRRGTAAAVYGRVRGGNHGAALLHTSVCASCGFRTD